MRPALVTASARRTRRIPIIWSVPLLAIALGLWLAWDTFSKRGPTITVSFNSGEGLQAGQSQLKYKDLVLGKVQSLRLASDHSRVLVTIATTREAGPLLTEQTVFWVATPRLFAGNLTGLETIISGPYVAMLPGTETGHLKREFVGREDPPILTTSVPGRTFLLKTTRLGSVSLGSPVFFRDLNVGEVLGWDIADMAESVTIRAFVRSPYDGYVHQQTRFWNASGVSLKLGSGGVELQLESLRALLLGGIAFETPVGTSPLAETDHEFPLFGDRTTADASSYTRKIPLVSYFSGSVRGLGPGSEVTIHGMVVGHVTDVRLIYDPARDAVLAPVRYEVEPERILGVGKRVFATPREGVDALVQQGWRSTLQSASLITGQQVVALEIAPNAPSATVSMEGSDFVMPAMESGGLATLATSASDLLRKVNDIPFGQIGAKLDDILQAVSDATQSAQMRQALTDISAMINRAKSLVGSLDSGASPALRQLPQITAGLERALSAVDKLAASLDEGYGNNTRFNRELGRLLPQLNDSLVSIRSLTDLLSRHPEALIRGRPAGGLQ